MNMKYMQGQNGLTISWKTVRVGLINLTQCYKNDSMSLMARTTIHIKAKLKTEESGDEAHEAKIIIFLLRRSHFAGKKSYNIAGFTQAKLSIITVA